MRIYAATSLSIGLFLQIGCAGLTLSPNATPSRMRAYNDQIAAQYVSANEFERQGEFEKARQIYQELHDKHPKNPDYLHRLAVVNTRLQRYGEAASFYERARLADPKNVRLLADMGYSSYLRGDLSTAEQTLREALKIQPGNARSINNLALVLGAQGKMDECQTLLQQLDNQASAMASLGYIHAKRGELSLAESRYREAIALNPNFDHAKAALSKLAQRHPPEDDFSAITPASFESRQDDSKTDEFVKAPAIQQVGATLDGIPSKVIHAAFVQPNSGSNEPGLLDEAPRHRVPSKLDETPATVLPAVFTDEQQTMTENAAESPSPDWDADTETPVSQPQDEDWANE